MHIFWKQLLGMITKNSGIYSRFSLRLIMSL
nr:MAG TPA: hypothetical protein [Caudoviricetes sp.]